MKKARSSSATAAAADTTRDYVSVGFWMLALFLMCVPIVNVITILLLAFVGENRSRQNYFRAIIGWFVVFLTLHLLLTLLGLSPMVIQTFRELSRRILGE